eukprot:SAG22_NODE_19116_length_278_cov_0.575419_1_plen_35_part_10
MRQHGLMLSEVGRYATHDARCIHRSHRDRGGAYTP